MINTSDPLDRLKAVDPVPPGTTLPRPDPVLFRRIVTGEQAVGRRPAVAPPHPRRARRLVPALAVTGVLGGAVAYAVLNNRVTSPARVACYAGADVEARTEIIAVGEGGPVEACADLWRRGVLGAGAEVPVLAECVLGSGVAGVFPTNRGDDVCARLGLATVPSTAPPPSRGSTVSPGQDQADVNARFLAFRDAVAPQFLDSPCMDPRTGEAIVRRELARAGLGDWSVVNEGFSAGRPCATLAAEPERQRVVLVPTPPRP